MAGKDMVHAVGQSMVFAVPECERKKVAVRHFMLSGVNHEGPAVAGSNPNRVLTRYLLPWVELIQKQIDMLHERISTLKLQPVILDGYPGDNLVGTWSYTAEPDLARLQDRVDTYFAVIQQVEDLPDDEQRGPLAEFVFLPIFYGSRHKVVGDINTPWIFTTADFCEPARIAKNLDYAMNLDDDYTGVVAYLRTAAEVAGDYIGDLKDFGRRIGRGFRRIGSGIGKALPWVAAGLVGYGMYSIAKSRRQGG